MSEPDHLWLKPMPNLMKGENPGAWLHATESQRAATGAEQHLCSSARAESPLLHRLIALRIPLCAACVLLALPSLPPPRCSRLPLLLH